MKDHLDTKPMIFPKRDDLMLRYSPSTGTDTDGDVEVFTIEDNIHIGTIHFNKVTRKYNYFARIGVFVQYTDSMLDSIAKIMNVLRKD